MGNPARKHAHQLTFISSSQQKSASDVLVSGRKCERDHLLTIDDPDGDRKARVGILRHAMGQALNVICSYWIAQERGGSFEIAGQLCAYSFLCVD